MNTQRYSRQTAIPTFGIEGQQRLQDSRILVIGAGGLGSPALLYLAAAGVGTLGLVETDVVDVSNLQRQILYTTPEIGQSKLVLAEARLRALNPNVHINTYPTRFQAGNALEIAADYHLILDATDNLATRYLVNDVCAILGLPWVYGAIYRFEGQVAVFNHQRGIDYRDLFPTPPPPELTPNCATAGVLGVMAGIIGTMQATEAIKVVANLGNPLDGELLLVDALTQEYRKIRIPKQLNRPVIDELMDYEAFCGLTTDEISWETYAKHPSHYILIDVREIWEHEEEHIGGLSIPMDELQDRLHEIPKDQPLVLHCLGGSRSQIAASSLRKNRPNQAIFSLQNGLRDVPEEAFIR